MEEVVVEALIGGNKEAQIQAASEISKLTRKQRQKLAERGVIAPLVMMLHSRDYEAIEAALFALLSLAFGSERNKIRLAKFGTIPILLNLLQSQSSPLIELAMAALLILSSCNANKIPIAQSGAIHLLVQTLSQNHITLQTKLDAISTLHNLSTSHHTIPLLVSSSLVFPLLQFIHNSNNKSSELVQKSMALLQNLVSSSKTALCEMAEVGIRELVEIVEEGDSECKEYAVGILLMICRSGRDKYRGLILREGVMPGLLQLSVDGTKRGKDMAGDLLLLLRDCENGGGRRNEFVELIMEEIDMGGERAVGKALKLVEEMIAKLTT